MRMTLEDDSRGGDFETWVSNPKFELHLMNLEGLGIVGDIEARRLSVGDRAANKQLVGGHSIDLGFVVARVHQLETIVVRK